MDVIAEIGSNFSSAQELLDAVAIAKRCGASAVKYQWFSKFDLYGDGHSDVKNFDEAMLGAISAECHKFEIEFMCSAFSPEAYKIVDKFVRRHKIASCEITDLEILETVNSFRKHVVISGGGSTNGELMQAMLALPDCPVTPLLCMGDYPSRTFSTKLFLEFAEYFSDHNIGYSDHTTTMVFDEYLQYLGCVALEKHVDFFNSKNSPDYGFALNEKEFKIYCASAKGLPYELPDQSTRKHKRAYNDDQKRYLRPT